MSRGRTALAALASVLLHALAREVDRGLGLVLRSEVEPQGLLAEVLRATAAPGSEAVVRVLLWLVAGTAAWVALARWSPRRDAVAFAPLLLRPALTALALLSVGQSAFYPYGFTLPVALTQDWGIAQDAASLAAVLALLLPLPRLPAPRPGEVLLLSFLSYAALAPDWAWRWEGHPGNEPKYLRQGVALGHDLTFDAEGVSAAMEDLPTRPLVEALPAAASTFVRESWRMGAALARGEAGRSDIRATRIARQTIRGKEGGVFYVLAPGPSLLLAPTFRVDRAINRARGEPGRVAVSVLTWCGLAALLVMVLFLLVRDVTGRPGLATALAFGFALVPPFLFYFYQFYPEMPGALVLAVAFRVLALRTDGLRRHPWLFGSLLATLPWLHQKFLPVWLALVATALWVGLASRGTAVDSGPDPKAPPRNEGRRRIALGLVVPTLLSLYLTALYNFAITGSVRPDALFLAWGPGGVTTARVGQGLLGLLLDARYGILPYVPLFALAAGGLVLGGARRFAAVLPAAAIYYLTVASADNWAGAVCNLGRYFMPVAPLLVALVAIAIDRAGGRRGVAALVLTLAAWSGLLALALWQDPHAANDSALLLAKGTYADGNQYIPNLFIRRWADGAPGLWARILAWLLGLGLLALWLRRAASPDEERRGAAGRSPLAALAGLTASLLVAAAALERWPASRQAPSFSPAMAVPASALSSVSSVASGEAPSPAILFLAGPVRVREREAVAGPGRVDLLLRASSAPAAVAMTIGGEGGVLRASGLPPLVLRPTGALVAVPFVPYHVVRGREGGSVAFARARLELTAPAVVRLPQGAVPGPQTPGPRAPEGEMEPDAGRQR